MARAHAFTPRPMVLILDGNTKMGVSARSNLCYLICVRHLNRSRENFSPKRPVFLHACGTYSELPSNISTTPRPQTSSLETKASKPNMLLSPNYPLPPLEFQLIWIDLVFHFRSEAPLWTCLYFAHSLGVTIFLSIISSIALQQYQYALIEL